MQDAMRADGPFQSPDGEDERARRQSRPMDERTTTIVERQAGAGSDDGLSKVHLSQASRRPRPRDSLEPNDPSSSTAPPRRRRPAPVRPRRPRPRLLGVRRALTACLQLAVGALEDEPVRSRVAHATVPEDQGRVALDHRERVLTVRLGGHGGLAGPPAMRPGGKVDGGRPGSDLAEDGLGFRFSWKQPGR